MIITFQTDLTKTLLKDTYNSSNASVYQLEEIAKSNLNPAQMPQNRMFGDDEG